MKNVLTLVIVHKMLIALLEIIGVYASVGLVIQAIHMALLVHQVRFISPDYLIHYQKYNFKHRKNSND